MALWGISTSDESKPKWLSDTDKARTFADSRGWVYTQPSGVEEVLCAIGGLATSLAAGTISSIEFVTTSFSEAAGGNIDIRVNYNEKVTVDTSGGTPTLTVTNDQAGGGTDATFAASYQSGSSTNRLTFRATYAAANGGVAENDVLTVAAQNIALNSGTIVDTGTSPAVNSGVAIPANTVSLTASA